MTLTDVIEGIRFGMTTTVIAPAPSEPADPVLVGQCLAHMPGAFDCLMQRHLRMVYNYLVHSVQDAGLAEDLTQETFLRAYRSLHRFDQRRAFKPWLLAIATNVGKTALKKRQTAPVLLHAEAMARGFWENLPEASPSASEISDPHLAEQVERALNQLPPQVRQALVLRHVHDLSYEEVAQVMQAKLNTVRTWLKRGRESLRVLLEPPIERGNHDVAS